MLIVVRHGDVGDKGRWDGPDLLRPLSVAGRMRMNVAQPDIVAFLCDSSGWGERELLSGRS